MTNLEISFRWLAVQGLIDIPYCFPQEISQYLRKRYVGPAVYRWLLERDSIRSIYIGETENLARRLHHYLKPGPSQLTNRRIRDLLDQEQSLGAIVSFDVLAFDPFSVNGHRYSETDLGNKEVRCFLENLLLSQLAPEIGRLNRLDSLQQKIIAHAALTLNPGMRVDEAKTIASKVLKKIGPTDQK